MGFPQSDRKRTEQNLSRLKRIHHSVPPSDLSYGVIYFTDFLLLTNLKLPRLEGSSDTGSTQKFLALPQKQSSSAVLSPRGRCEGSTTSVLLSDTLQSKMANAFQAEQEMCYLYIHVAIFQLSNIINQFQ